MEDLDPLEITSDALEALADVQCDACELIFDAPLASVCDGGRIACPACGCEGNAFEWACAPSGTTGPWTPPEELLRFGAPDSTPTLPALPSDPDDEPVTMSRTS